MINPYSLIVGLFLVAGLVTTLWGISIIIKARKTAQWPNVEGSIQESRLSSDDHDLLPHIEFSYTVEQKQFRRTLEFPPDITPTQEFSALYVERYPQGARVKVYYDPAAPGNATLEPGLAQGDWLVLGFGLATVLMSVAFFFFGG